MFDLTILTTAASSFLPTIMSPETILTTIVMSASGFISDPSTQQIAFGTYEVSKGILFLCAAGGIAYTCWLASELSVIHGAEIIHFFGAGREELNKGKRRIFSIFRRKNQADKDDEEDSDE
jgi:hypothetical protein